MKLLAGIFLIFLVIDVAALPPDESITLEKLSFGSCAGLFNKKANIFEDVAKENAQVWLWLGDVAYVDTFIFPNFWVNSSPEYVKKTFDHEKSDRNYQKIIAQSQILGVWDDHDYNHNNGNKHNPTKDWVQQLFLEYLDEPESSLRWNQKGLYTSYNYGDEDHRVKIIILDTRYFCDSSKDGPNADNLGETQWEWLEQQLIDAKSAKFTIIASSIQVLPDDRIVTERLLPYTRKRMFDLLALHETEGVIFLSGDVHYGEVMRAPCPIGDMKYGVYEFTSSGLSHHASTDIPLEDYFMECFFPKTYNVSERVIDFNYGIIEFDWSDLSNPEMTLKVMQSGDRVFYQETIKRSQLMIPQHDNSAESNCILDQTASQRFFGYALNSWAYPSRAAYMVMLIVLVAFL
eukprot:CAMPEP_0115046480 /NCGR_PEP_ID=MMETSP0216-20121206/48771_1 /TAXON_ID=223996 /ORGANISM="Protocruzia adherens, Strain Boccale" /LENGTH=402 /DNA_ID=CAMNT_0002429563 /DNA_START=141 /DNA_END=1346 /DNA_ORIENTATION=+